MRFRFIIHSGDTYYFLLVPQTIWLWHELHEVYDKIKKTQKAKEMKRKEKKQPTNDEFMKIYL